MASVHDVAAYILERLQAMSTMKLQKLVYYSQAWHLVWDDAPLFKEDFQAWANGPVVRELYLLHRGRFSTEDSWPAGSSSELSPNERETIDAVIRDYGHLTGRQLSFLTHSEDPWSDAREGLPPTATCSTVIAKDDIARYYAAIDSAAEASPVEDLNWSDWDASIGDTLAPQG